LTLSPTGGTWIDGDGSQEGYFRVIATSGDLRAEIRGQVVIEEAGGDPYYTVTVAPSTDTIVEIGCVSYTVTVTPFNGYTGTVNLSLAYPLPFLVGATFTPPVVVITDGPETSILEICDSNVECEPELPCDPIAVNFQEVVVVEPHGGGGADYCPPPFYSGDVTMTSTWTVTLFCNGIEMNSYSGSRTKTVAWNPPIPPNPGCGGWNGISDSVKEVITTPYGGFEIFVEQDGCVACN
jgi:hypothetical protein